MRSDVKVTFGFLIFRNNCVVFGVEGRDVVVVRHVTVQGDVVVLCVKRFGVCCSKT